MPSIFLSYSHKDEIWKERLKAHLGAVHHLDVWDDRRIGVGADWLMEIQEAMNRASVAILFISADFLASKFVLKEEIPRLLERRREEGLKVFPVILRSCAWQEADWLHKIQIQPLDGRPLAGFRGDQRDRKLTDIAREVRKILDGTDLVATHDPSFGIASLPADSNAGTVKILNTSIQGVKRDQGEVGSLSIPEEHTTHARLLRHRRFAKKSCYVSIPIVDEFREVYAMIASVVEDLTGCRVFRTDDTRRPGIVTERIVHDLVNSDLVIAVVADPRMTNFPNPYVMYELGVAHSFRKPTIVLADKQNALPFDLLAVETIQLDFSNGVSPWELKDALRFSLTTSKVLDEVESKSIPRNPVTTELAGTRVFIEDLPWLWGYHDVLKREREAQTIWEISSDLFWPTNSLFFQSIREGVRVGRKYYFMVPDDEGVLQKANSIKRELQRNFSASEVDALLQFVAVDRQYFSLFPIAIILYDADLATRRGGILCGPMSSGDDSDLFEQAARRLLFKDDTFGNLEILEDHITGLSWLERHKEASFDIGLDGRLVDSLAYSFAKLWNEKIFDTAKQKASEQERSDLLSRWLIGS